jgi:hypothetical protein
VFPPCKTQLPLLLETLRQIPDPFGKKVRLRIGPMSTLVSLGLPASRRDFNEIARIAPTLSWRQRHLLVLPRKKEAQALWQILNHLISCDLLFRMDFAGFAQSLDDWLLAHAGEPPQALAPDGKTIHEHLGVLTLAQHENGARHITDGAAPAPACTPSGSRPKPRPLPC